jgi:zinc/manganese transport system substrate-binding protein
MIRLLLIYLIYTVLFADVKIITSTGNIAAIAKALGKDKVTITVIVKEKQNPHSIQILPSYMMKVARADIYLLTGLKLDYWAQQIIDGSRNTSLKIVDCSLGIEAIEKPVGSVDPSKGHIHPDGNPHYTLDPSYAILAAKNILKALKKADEENAEFYEINFQNFKKSVQTLMNYKDSLKGKPIIAYHSSFNYLINFLGLKMVDTIEPLPGISPSASHLNKLLEDIKSEKVNLIIQENFYNKKAANFLVEKTKIRLMLVSPYSSEINENSYVKHMEQLIKEIEVKI